jgi:hypothetical protein
MLPPPFYILIAPAFCHLVLSRLAVERILCAKGCNSLSLPPPTFTFLAARSTA